MSDQENEDIPTCPTCKEEMVPTVTGDDSVVEEPGKFEVVIGAGWECDNVNCPESGDTDLAPANPNQ